MPSTRELRRRIKSVQNTSQITKAMQMIAANRMRKAQSQAMAGRPYNETLTSLLSNLLSKVESDSHPLLTPNDSKTSGVLVLTTDKSLCGALNTNVFRTLAPFIKTKSDLKFYTVGKKGREFIARTRLKLEADFENTDVVQFKSVRVIARLLTEDYLAGKLGEVYLAFPHFESTLKQVPTLIKLLPAVIEKTDKSTKTPENDLFLFEPNAKLLLDQVLNHFIESQIYQALLETKASEFSARMIAMKNATDNAKELVTDLKLTYNQTRQNSITAELLEISSAGAALQ